MTAIENCKFAPGKDPDVQQVYAKDNHRALSKTYKKILEWEPKGFKPLAENKDEIDAAKSPNYVQRKNRRANNNELEQTAKIETWEPD